MAANELFPKRLRALRERRQIKRRVLAELCGLSQHMIRRYEEGEMEPKASSLEVLADYFEVTVDYLLGREKKSGKGLKSPSHDGKPAKMVHERVDNSLLYHFYYPKGAQDGRTFTYGRGKAAGVLRPA